MQQASTLKKSPMVNSTKKETYYLELKGPKGKSRGPKDILEICQAHEQDQATNPNPVTRWPNG